MKMSPAYLQLAEELIPQVVAFYARRCWWLDTNDATQQAWLCALTLKLDDVDEATCGAYLYRVLSRSLSRWCWGQSSAFSASSRLEKQACVPQRVPLPENVATEDLEQVLIDVERRAVFSQLRHALARRIGELLERQRRRAPERTSAVISALVGGGKLAHVARQHGLTAKDLQAPIR